MNITFIGSGNVAHGLCYALNRAGHKIAQVISAHPEHARKLAEKYAAEWSDEYTFIDPASDIVILAVSDDAIDRLNQNLRLQTQLVVHTAGGIPMQAINEISSHIGVFYPLQTFNKALPFHHNFPLLLESNTRSGKAILDPLARSIAGRVAWMTSEKRLKIHVAGVFCNNFTNRLVALAQDFCKKESLDFTLLEPLLHETFERIFGNNTEQIQTGPARRGDRGTMELHTRVLNKYPDMQKIYEIFSTEIKRFYNKK